MIEPANSAECKEFTKLAYTLSEQFDTPFILRLTTRVSHSGSAVELEERQEHPIKEYTKDPAKHVMMPGNAKRRHPVVEQRLAELADYAYSDIKILI